MYKALKDNKIIAINNTGDFPCLVMDEVVEDTEHTLADYVQCDGEFVLTTSEEAEEQRKIARVAELKALLASKDYIGTKIATGCATVEDYAEEIAQCEAWREEIRSLENS